MPEMPFAPPESDYGDDSDSETMEAPRAVPTAGKGYFGICFWLQWTESNSYVQASQHVTGSNYVLDAWIVDWIRWDGS